MVCEAALDDDVGQHRIRGRHAGADGEGVQEGDMRHHGPDEEGCCEPHAGHDGPDEQGHGLPLRAEVPAGQLDAGENQLNAEDEAGEGKGNALDVLFRAGIFQRSDEVCCGRGEGHAREEGYH